MQVIRQIPQLKARIADLRREGSESVGFVPTMGYLHEGHLSLLHAAKAANEIVVLSIFVNPLQFGPNEDFDKYPRDEERDLQLAERAGADIVFLPAVEEMYPVYPLLSKVSVDHITSRLCGAARPGHFDGVATVVMKLFNIVQPDRAYFGLKDAQQVAVIQQMTDDLNINVEIVPCPTLRESDGLAMSSRNVYLNPEERKQAIVLSQTLQMLETFAAESDVTIPALRKKITEHILTASLAQIDYVEILSYPMLSPFPEQTLVSELKSNKGVPARIIVALAVKFGNTRLIDNRIVQIQEVTAHV